MWSSKSVLPIVWRDPCQRFAVIALCSSGTTSSLIYCINLIFCISVNMYWAALSRSNYLDNLSYLYGFFLLMLICSRAIYKKVVCGFNSLKQFLSFYCNFIVFALVLNHLYCSELFFPKLANSAVLLFPILYPGTPLTYISIQFYM